MICKTQNGFSLVELMVVVAIIGILSAIAVPNFKKYQNKSKQTEAKILLSTIYNIEVASQADFDSFGTCLADLGFDQPPKGFYISGFFIPYLTGVSARIPCSSSPVVIPTMLLKANAAAASPSQSSLDNTSTASPSTFKASAAGNIRSNSLTYDVWTINEKKFLQNSVSDF